MPFRLRLPLRCAAAFRRAPIALATALALPPAGSPARAAEPVYPCAGSYQPLERRAPLSPLVTTLILPLAIIDQIGRDHLGEKPRKAVPVRVVGTDGKPVSGARVGVIHLGDDRFLADFAAADGRVSLPEGQYRFNAALPGDPMRWGTAVATVGAGAPKEVRITLDGTIEKVVPGAIAPTAPAASRLVVPFGGFKEGVLGVVAPGSTRMETESGLDETGEGSVPMPGRPGTYRVVYMLCAPRLVLADWTIRVEKPEIAADAPAEVVAGDRFEVVVRGRSYDQSRKPVLVRPVKGEDPDHVDTGELVAMTTHEYRFRFDAPFVPGAYRLDFEAGDGGQRLLTRPITVTPKVFELDLPDAISIEEAFAPRFKGPDGSSVELWALGKDGKPTTRVAEAIKTDLKRFPAAAGRYEARLVSFGLNGVILARRPITVTGRAFAEPPPASVAPGGSFRVAFTRKAEFFDKVYVVPAGRKEPEFGTDRPFGVNGRQDATVTAPTRPGRYEVVYVMGRPGTKDAILERVPIEVK